MFNLIQQGLAVQQASLPPKKSFQVEVSIQRPGWDEFDYTREELELVSAYTPEQAKEVAQERFGKFATVIQVKEVQQCG